ncbi:MAG: hypothetical protein K2I04_01465, partial [Muribaculaceae bacterium]|nr:hypothetical protein [Muribaculaceae bacterium]
MDMQDPSKASAQEPLELNSNEATAAAAGAGIENVAATSTDGAVKPEAEVEVEDIMADGMEEEAARADKREHTAESLLADALALLEKDAAECSSDDIRRRRQQYSMLHRPAVKDATQADEEAPAEEPA